MSNKLMFLIYTSNPNVPTRKIPNFFRARKTFIKTLKKRPTAYIILEHVDSGLGVLISSTDELNYYFHGIVKRIMKIER